MDKSGFKLIYSTFLYANFKLNEIFRNFCFVDLLIWLPQKLRQICGFCLKMWNIFSYFGSIVSTYIICFKQLPYYFDTNFIAFLVILINFKLNLFVLNLDKIDLIWRKNCFRYVRFFMQCKHEYKGLKVEYHQIEIYRNIT